MAVSGRAETLLPEKPDITKEMKLRLTNPLSSYFILPGIDISRHMAKNGTAGFVHRFATTKGTGSISTNPSKNTRNFCYRDFPV